jgi:GMP synthase-like glutamine amidotransferase
MATAQSIRGPTVMRVHWLQHAENEGLGCIEPWLRTRGFQITHSDLHRGDALPDPRDFDWLIAMGGPMNIYQHDQHPWLAPEKALIRQACLMKKRFLGICLGAQLAADVLGGKVSKNREWEIGWFDVSLNAQAGASRLFDEFPPRFPAFHWHEDMFSVPPGGQLLMSSEACPNQGYVWGGGQVVGLQFHLEVRHEDAEIWLRGETLPAGRHVQSPDEILRDPARFASNRALVTRLLERMAEPVGSGFPGRNQRTGAIA